MAPLKISDTVRITCDSRQFILEERSDAPSPTTGKYIWYPIAFHGTITDSLKYYFHYHLRQSPKELPEAVKDAVELIEEAMVNIHHKLQLTLQV